MTKPSGRVYLVGAGPGAPDLITMRGAEVISRADVIIYDYLASPEIIRLAPSHAEKIYAGKRGGGDRRFDQDEINRLMIKRARSGLNVIRLKGGDPFIFGRGGEEAEALKAAGIDFEVVPGISSAIAAPAFAGIPLSHREHGSLVVFVTGHSDAIKGDSSELPWDDLARIATRGATIVVLMGAARVREIVARMMQAGLPGHTAAAAIEWATTASQRVVLGTASTLPQEAKRAGIAAPAVIVIGNCAALGSELRWFEKLPLFGRRIVITRDHKRNTDFATPLRRAGAEVIEFPVIEFAAPDDYRLVDDAISRIGAFNWIIFTSATGVDAFVERVRTLGADIRSASGASIAAIGPATAHRVEHYGIRVAAMPTEYRAEAIIEAIGADRIAGARFLIPRAQTAREVLPERLLAMGAREVTIAPVYKTIRPADSDEARVRELAKANKIDLVTFTSSSTVSNFNAIIGDTNPRLKAAAIGPITASTASNLGYEVVVSPQRYTIESLTDAILAYFAPRPH